MNRVVFSTSLLILVSLSSCQTRSPDGAPLTDADRQAIEATVAANLKAFLEKDGVALAATYTDDGVQLPPNQAAWVGREAIRSRPMEDEIIALTSSTEAIDGEGSLAYWRGTYHYEGIGPGEETPSVEDGKWVVVLRKQPDGSWLIAFDIWNYPVPSEAGGTAASSGL